MNIASPGSPLTGAWAPGAGSEHRAFDPRDWSVEGKKLSKELRTFDGDIAHYDNWRRRVRDHFMAVNCNYSVIVELIEIQKVPIRWNKLATTQVSSLPHVNWEWLATHLWTFTGEYLDDNMLSRRMIITAGEEFNGFELWRHLFQQHSGGSAQLENLKRAYFVDFPKCERLQDLQPHLAQWCQLKGKYGVGLPIENLIAMFWKILPDEVCADVKKKRDIKYDLDLQIADLYGQLGDNMDEKLSRWSLSKLQQPLKFKGKSSTGMNAIEMTPEAPSKPSTNEAPPPPMPDAASFQANLERMVNAAVTRERGRQPTRTPPGSRGGSSESRRTGNLRIPNPKFEGCWCCGKKGHTRRECPDWNALIKANGGKVPTDDVGAYERSMGKSDPIKSVSAVSITSTSHPEHAEPVKLWPLLQTPKPVIKSNCYQGFDSEDDDEQTMIHSLTSMTPHVKVVNRQKKKKKHKKTDLARLNAIARRVKNGEISLPEVDLDHDNDFYYVWALVVSGAGASVARKGQLPNWTKVDAREISLTVANGDVMPNAALGV